MNGRHIYNKSIKRILLKRIENNKKVKVMSTNIHRYSSHGKIIVENSEFLIIEWPSFNYGSGCPERGLMGRPFNLYGITKEYCDDDELIVVDLLLDWCENIGQRENYKSAKTIINELINDSKLITKKLNDIDYQGG